MAILLPPYPPASNGKYILDESKNQEDDGGTPDDEGELDGYFSVPHDDPPKWLFMYTAYLDETGQDAQDWVFIAGFMGKKEHWGALVSPWKEGLGPQRKSLHMAELRFKKDKDNEKNMLERLSNIPVQSGLIPVIGGICVHHFKDLLMGNPFLEKLHNGYVSALMPLVIQVLDWLPSNERVEIVFEQQDRYFGLADFVFSEMIRHGAMPYTLDGKPKLAKWSSVPKGSTCLTEPADYYAYAIAQDTKDRTSIRAQWTKPILDSIDTVQTVGRVMDRGEARTAITRLLKQVKLENILLPGSDEAFEKFRELSNRVSKIPLEERQKIEKEIDDEEPGI